MKIKKTIVCEIIIVCSLLIGCSRPEKEKNVDNNSEIVIDVGLTEHTETEACSGIEKGSMEIGNKSEILLKNGRYYQSEDKNFFVNAKDELIAETGDGNGKLYDGFVFGGLNYYKDRLYFIEKNTYKVYSVKEDGTDLKNEVEEEVYYLLMCEDGMVYVDKNSSLFHKENSGEVKLIKEGPAIWENVYGEWIIYVDLSGEEHPVIAYNLKTEEEHKILDYGFFTVLYDDELFYQGEDSFIYQLNLLNGERKKIAEVWGQNFVKIKDRLYFCGGNKISYVNLTNVVITDIYDIGKKTIQEMWEQDGMLYFKETFEENETYKIYEQETGNVIDYE